jgi:4-aminobutyrate aminotransferase-like enzyme
MLKLNVPGPKAQALIERDKKVVSSSYPRGYPFVMDHGRGVEVWDPDGNRYIDFMSGIAVLSTGHANPPLRRRSRPTGPPQRETGPIGSSSTATRVSAAS